MSTKQCFSYGLLAIACLWLVADIHGYVYLLLISVMLLGLISDDRELHYYGRFWIAYYFVNLVETALMQFWDYRPIGGYGLNPLWIDPVIYATTDLIALAVFSWCVLIEKINERFRIWLTSCFFLLNICAHSAIAYLARVPSPGLPEIYDGYLYLSFYVVLVATIIGRVKHGVANGTDNMRHLSNSRSVVMGDDK